MINIIDACKKLARVELNNGNIVKVFPDLVYEGIPIVEYNIADGKGGIAIDKNGDEHEIRDCYCYSLNGVKINLAEVKGFGNNFYELIKGDELKYFTNIHEISDGETWRLFNEYAKIKSLSLGGVISLPAYSLFRCINLEKLNIPSVLTNIETYAIASCDGLQSLTVDDKNPVYTSRDSNGNECNCIIDKATVSGELDLIQGCNVSTIPDNTTKISSGAFYECTGIHSITIPNTVREIGDNVFRGCIGLNTKVTIPSSVESIGSYTFKGCTNLPAVECNVENIPKQLFKDCTNLSSVTLNNTVSMDNQAFFGCENISAIAIPDSVTSIGSQTFMNCSSLQNIEFPDTLVSVGTSCFANTGLRSVNTNRIGTISNNMFAGCSNLSSVTFDDEYTTVIGSNAFSGCTSLSGITITEGITNIDSSAFMSCSNLQTVTIGSEDSNLTTIPTSCFMNCSNLQTVYLNPNHKINLQNSNAFSNCPNLIEIIVPDNLVQTYKESEDWYEYRDIIFGRTQITVTFDANGGETAYPAQTVRLGVKIQFPGTEHKDLYVFNHWETENGDEWDFDNDVPYDNMTLYANYDFIKALMVKSASNDVTNISMSYFGRYPANVEYSYDGRNWHDWLNEGYSEKYISLSEGYNNYIYFRGYNPNGFSRDSSSNYSRFNINNGQCDLLGNLMYLKDYNNIVNSLSNYDFVYLFLNCYAIRNCNKLTLFTSATTLAQYCYQNMFEGCSGLTTAPALPATTLEQSCYDCMFRGCTSLTTAPELPATTLANSCYFSMFLDCSSLTNTPSILPATTLANNCYNSMFMGCTSLTTAPELPATTLASDCYNEMFNGCTSLTTAPVLPATTLAYSCYFKMFCYCSRLTTAPELPATTLANSCYRYMFYGCTSLTTAPELPATTLPEYCYGSMFYGCSNLNYIKCLATNISASYCTNSWVVGVASTGTFVKNANMTGWTTGYNGIPDNWTVEDAVLE